MVLYQLFLLFSAIDGCERDGYQSIREREGVGRERERERKKENGWFKRKMYGVPSEKQK